MKLTADQIIAAIGCKIDNAHKWVDPLNATMDRYQINTPARMAAFIAQVGYESALLSAISENLNYSASALLAMFKTHFTKAEAEAYARKPQAIANRIYANRYGNGSEASGDGWKYRGRGLIQLTFKDNYRLCGAALGLDLVASPELLTDPSHAAMAAGWYWDKHQCNAMADGGHFDVITRAINGGLNGEAQREILWAKAKQAMGAA
jgi:putative chitinase